MVPSLLKVFYTLKPFIPRSAQILIRRFRARKIFSSLSYPYVNGGAQSSVQHSQSLSLSSRSFVLLTHDVETAYGIDVIPRIRQAEKEFGFSSTWNFVMDKYGPVDRHVKELQDDGCECGAHGLYHDGKLFSSSAVFYERMDKLIQMAAHLSIKGFRSPSLLRDMNMLESITFDWDSSLPSWDPFQPQAGGCNRYLPFFLNEITLELPVTMWQDFTLFTELQEKSPSIWIAQATELLSSGCLVNIIVHPDYYDKVVEESYRYFLRFLRTSNAVVVLPSAIVDHYRNR